MRKINLILIILFLAIVNCSSPMKSYIFTSTTQHTTGGSTGNLLSSATVDKMGESCSKTYLFLNVLYYGKGASIEEAKKAGNITKVAVVDRRSYNILGVVLNEECIVVWGE